MRIYVDFDDVICDTARGLLKVTKDLFGVDVPFEKLFCFDLQCALGLTEEQFVKMMQKGHEEESLISLTEIPGAVETLNKWIDEGNDVQVVTGRPFYTYNVSRKWLDEHGLSRIKLIHVDKYGREKFYNSAIGNLSLDEFSSYKYDFAVEDSPLAFKSLEAMKDCTVAVMDRPWNKEAELKERFHRCSSWQEIIALKAGCDA